MTSDLAEPDVTQWRPSAGTESSWMDGKAIRYLISFVLALLIEFVAIFPFFAHHSIRDEFSALDRRAEMNANILAFVLHLPASFFAFFFLGIPAVFILIPFIQIAIWTVVLYYFAGKLKSSLSPSDRPVFSERETRNFKFFFKSFLIAILAQSLFTGLAFLIPSIFGIFGIIAYVCYMAPFVLIAGNTSSHQKIEVSTFELFGIFIVIWSIAIGFAATVVRDWVRRRNDLR